MAITDSQDTLAYHGSRPLTRARPLSLVACSAVAARIALFRQNDPHPHTSPEAEALWFYGMNHGLAFIRQAKAPLEPLVSDELAFVHGYHAVLGPKAVRAFYYLLLICVRESRHCKNKPAMQHQLSKVHGKTALDYLSKVPDHPTQAMDVFTQSPPVCRLGQLTGMLRDIFYQGSWSSNYGGPAWGKVADCLHRFISGELTAEMMLDTVWTLAHNNGPIFNKGMFYGCHGSSLLRVLDLQRAGQVPTAIVHDGPIQTLVQPPLRKWMMWLRTEFAAAVGDYVDWYQVEALGSVGKYPSEKAMQSQTHGKPDSVLAAEALLKKQQAAAAAKAKQTAEQHAKKFFFVMPGLELPKIDRNAA